MTSLAPPTGLELPIVSIIVPVYNGGTGLKQCLNGIRQSSYQNYELIVVDNGSTDDSISVAQKYGDLILHCPGPSGPGATRNMGARRARGEILFFVDADVVIRSDTLAKLVASFQMHIDVAAVFGSYDDQPPASNFLSQYKNLFHHFVHQEGNPDASTFWGGCGGIRRDIFQEVNGFDQDRYPFPSIEDIELGYRLHRKGYRILLDRNIQVTHLKEWRLKSLLRAEILYRAVPWSKLIFERKEILDDLNLKVSQRICGVLACLIFLLLPISWLYPIIFFSLIISSAAIIFYVNRKLFLFFFQRGGFLFLFQAYFMHTFYYFYSATTFVICRIQFAIQGR